MSIFGRSKKDKAHSVMQRLAEQAHRLTIHIGMEMAESVVLGIKDNCIVLGQFEPRGRNELLSQFTNIRVRTQELFEFDVLHHSFQTDLVDQIDWNGGSAYRFEMPKAVSTKSEPYILEPNPQDHVTLSFHLNEIQQFKKVESISGKEIRFKGALAPHRELFGKVVYNIELKTPFDRLKLSAVFRHLKGEDYAFTDFMTDESIAEAMQHYVLTDYLRTQKLETFIERDGTKPTGEVKEKQEQQRRKRVLLVDDKKVITDIVGEILQTRTDYLVSATNDSLEAINMAVEQEPDVILLDLNMPGMDGITVARKLRQNRITSHIPIVFMTASHDSRRVKEAQELGVAHYMVKPIDTTRLLQVLGAIVARNEGVAQLMQRKVALLSDDSGFSFDLMREMSSRQLEADEFTYTEEFLRRSDLDSYGLVILRLLRQASPLTIVNAIRRKPALAGVPLVVFPRSASEANLCRALMDDNLYLVENAMEPAAFAANLGSYFR